MLNDPVKVTTQNSKTSKQTIWTFKFRKSRDIMVNKTTVTMGSICPSAPQDEWHNIAHWLIYYRRLEVPVDPQTVVDAYNAQIGK